MTRLWPSAPSLRRTLGVFALAGLALLGLGVAALYRARGSIGAAAAVEYLRTQGVPAKIRLDRLDAHGFSGSAVLGPANRPDLTVDHLEGRFAPGGQARGLLPRVIGVTLVHPQLRATYDGRHLSFGSLQGLITSLGRSKGGGPAPDVLITDGVLLTATPWGAMTADVEAQLHAGGLVDASVHLAPGRLQQGRVSERGLTAVLTVRAPPGGPAIADLHLAASAVSINNSAARDVDLAAHIEAPSGALAFETQRGRLTGLAILKARVSDVGGARLIQPSAKLTLDGLIRADQLVGDLSAHLVVALRADAEHSANVSAQALAADLASNDLAVSWTSKGVTAGGSFTTALAASQGQAALKGLADNRLLIERLQANGSGRARFSDSIRDLSISGGVAVDGGLARPLNLERPSQPSQPFHKVLNALGRSVLHVHVDAPQVAISADRRGYQLSISKGLSARASTGMAVQIRPLQDRPLATLAAGVVDGSFQARIQGGDLPQIDVGSAVYHGGADEGGAAFTLKSEVDGSGSVGGFEGVRVSAGGALARRRGVLTFVATRCADVSLDAYRQEGVVSLTSFKAQLCPKPRPWFADAKGRWSADASIRALSATLPSALTSLTVAEADLSFAGAARAPPSGRVELQGAALRDQSPQSRFKPLTASGRITMANRRLQGDLAMALIDPGLSLGRGTVSYDVLTKNGQATVRIEDLKFSPGGLQPSSLSPLLAQWASNARGDLSGSADLSWTDGRLTSRALVKLTTLDFKSPVGAVSGLKGSVVLSSLAPLTAEPGQTLTADRLSAFIPLTKLKASFGLTPNAFFLQGATAVVADGSAGLAPMQIPLASGSTIVGSLTLKGVDLQSFIDSTSLSEAVSVKARMNGVLPFSIGPAGVRFSNGSLSAAGPGRLTIHRQALTGAVATAGANGAQPNAVQDFAYQALEDLAFESLSAEVSSRPEGRLGLLLRVKGRHDPAVSSPTRLNLIDLARGHAFDKPIPLPKGTPVNLTLDGSLNFDELMAAYGAFTGGAGSAKVQPKP